MDMMGVEMRKQAAWFPVVIVCVAVFFLAVVVYAAPATRPGAPDDDVIRAATLVNILTGALLTLIGLTVSAVVWGVRANARIVTREVNRLKDSLERHSRDIVTLKQKAEALGVQAERYLELANMHQARLMALSQWAAAITQAHKQNHPDTPDLPDVLNSWGHG